MNRIFTTLSILDYYDGPEVLLVSDQFGARHLMNLAAEEDGVEEFVTTLISPERFEQLVKQEIDLRGVYLSPEIPEFFVVRLTGGDSSFVGIPFGSAQLPERLLPPEGINVPSVDPSVFTGPKPRPRSPHSSCKFPTTSMKEIVGDPTFLSKSYVVAGAPRTVSIHKRSARKRVENDFRDRASGGKAHRGAMKRACT